MINLSEDDPSPYVSEEEEEISSGVVPNFYVASPVVSPLVSVAPVVAAVSPLTSVAPTLSRPSRKRSTPDPPSPRRRNPFKDPPTKRAQSMADVVALKKSVKNSAPNTAKNVTSETVKELYTSERFLGNITLKVVLLAPASEAPELGTRGLDMDHVNRLVSSMRNFSSGNFVRDAFKVNLQPILSHITRNAFVRLCQRLRQLDIGARASELNDSLERLEIQAITIGGNHSREACQTLIRDHEPGWEHFYTVQCDVFYNMNMEEARAVGFVDNVVSNTTQAYTLQNKVSLIRDLYRNNEYLVKLGRLNPKALEIACFSYMYSNKKTAKEDGPKARAERIQRAMPFIKSCNVPEILWPTVSKSLSNEKLTMQVFRSVKWSCNPEKMKEAFDLFNLDGDINKLKNVLASIKAHHRIQPAVVRVWKALDPQSTSRKVDFLEDFDNVCSLSGLAETFSKPLNALRGHNILESAELTERVRAVLKRMKNPDPESQENEFFVSNCCNRAGTITTHSFRELPAVKFIGKLKKDNVHVGLVIMDPPFGLLNEDWDQSWPPSHWISIFAELVKNYQDSPVLVFLSYQQFGCVMEAAALAGYHRIVHYAWLKTAHQVAADGRISYPTNPILLFSRINFTWYAAGGYRTNGNFVATPQISNYRRKGLIVNPTEKPVVLLRSFIANLCERGKSVLDLCCGSGSTAMAAASLGFNSYGCDIRLDQVEACVERLKSEYNLPSFYPSPEVVHDFSALRLSLKKACEEEKLVVPKKPRVPKLAPKKSSKPNEKESPAVSNDFVGVEEEDEEDPGDNEKEENYDGSSPEGTPSEDDEMTAEDIQFIARDFDMNLPAEEEEEAEEEYVETPEVPVQSPSFLSLDLGSSFVSLEIPTEQTSPPEKLQPEKESPPKPATKQHNLRTRK